MCARTSVENIAKNVQAVNGESLYKIAECCYKVLGASCAYDCLYNDTQIGLFVLYVVALVQKLLDYVGILLGEALAHL